MNRNSGINRVARKVEEVLRQMADRLFPPRPIPVPVRVDEYPRRIR